MATILFIDDDTVLLKLYATRLTSDKHVVYTAINGEEGLDILTKITPDVIVLDLLMPKLNGFAFIERLNQIPSANSIKKIVFSSVANTEQIDRLKALGITTFLNKTDTTPTQLVTIINQMVPPPTANPNPSP